MFIDVMKCELYVSVTFRNYNNLSDQQSVMKPYASTLLPYIQGHVYGYSLWLEISLFCC